VNISLNCGISMRSYGIVGFNLLRELVQQGHEVALFPIGGMEVLKEHESLIKQSLDNQRSFDRYAPSVRVFHEWDVLTQPGRGPQIAFPFFELDKLPDEYPRMTRTQLANVDKIIVASSWAKSIIEQGIPNCPPIEVVPLGIDSDVFYPAPPNDGPYTFYVGGKFELRKSHDIICQVFSRVFTPKDNVRLRLMCDNPFLGEKGNKEWYDYYLNSPMGSKVEIVPWQNSPADVAEIMRSCDCGLFPSRAEGFNLPLLEFMSQNRPVITTAATAHTQFCNNLNSLLIEPSEYEDAYDGIWFDGKNGQWMSWTKKETDRLAELMSYVYNSNVRENPNGVMTGQKMQWGHSAQKLINAIS
jgi:glycosyltransferase involved in cell wall biosynthesis